MTGKPIGSLTENELAYHPQVTPSRAAILVVDDDADLRRLYRLALALAGFAVEEATDGFDALQKLDANTPDLVVLDLDMPRINGFTVLQELAARASTQHVPVIVVTGLSAMPNGPCVLRKPVSPDRLIQTIRDYLADGTTDVAS